MHTVIRQFGIDYIYFDLLFLTLFIFLLVKEKKWIAFFAFLAGGLSIFIIDWFFWLRVFKIRTVSLPPDFLPFLSPWLALTIFMFWFSMSYGLLFSWMFLMFDEKTDKVKWTALLFGGWLGVAFLSQFIPLHDAIISPVRHMGSSRVMQIIIVCAGYLLLFLLRYKIKRIGYLFLVGCGAHFMMEFSLWISGIRPSSLDLLLVNSLIESNMGVPILFIVWDKVIRPGFVREKSAEYYQPVKECDES